MNSKPVSAWIAEVTFSDKKSYKFLRNDKVIFVGPNNSGKSLALREIKSTITSSPNSDLSLSQMCVRSLTLGKSGNSAALRTNISKFGKRDKNNKHDAIYYYGPYRIDLGLVDWFNGSQMGSIGNIFVRHIDTENRLKATVPENNVSAGEPKANAQQLLYDDSVLFEEISEHFKESFGSSLVLDYRSGSKVNIHVGKRPERAPIEELVSNSYVDRVRKLPPLSEQGDGMRGYAGILFEALVTKHDITLIDEPEAFLHPPQMRKLARTLGDHSTGQLFISTHSSDILRGFLDSSSSDVRIIRLQRDGDINSSKETPASTVRELWENPDLKYSNALEGIFHEICVICEDDSDCRFYNAIADYMEASNKQERWPDAIYIPCGGKHAIPKLATALHTLGVPVRIVVDLDALSEEGLIEKLVVSVGGAWTELLKDWRIFSSGVQRGVKPKSIEEIKEQVRALLDNEPGLPKGKISEAMKSDSSWNILKTAGRSAIPKGDCRAAFDRLVAGLAAIGIYAVPEGQIEGFLPSVGSHGPSFVSSALKAVSLGSEEMKSARDFVRQFAGPL